VSVWTLGFEEEQDLVIVHVAMKRRKMLRIRITLHRMWGERADQHAGGLERGVAARRNIEPLG